MSRIRVAVIRGGLSDAYSLSMNTGADVLSVIDTDIYEPVDIIIAKNGEWLIDGRVRMPEYVLHSVDVAFNALHGTFGEDGTIQRLFDRYGVAYTGSKALSSGIAMNKILTKELVRKIGVKTAPHVQVSQDAFKNLGQVTQGILNAFGPQYIIKPVTSGSSVGTMSVRNPLLLEQALRDALSRHDEVIVEARIQGREATTAVIERYREKLLYTLPPIEVELPQNADFLSHEAKCTCSCPVHCPSRFDANTKSALEDIAQRVHETIGLSQYSQADFIVTNDDEIYFLEVNSLPQLSKSALIAKSLDVVGARYSDFINHLLTDTLSSARRI